MTGYLLGENWPQIEQYAEVSQIIAISAVVITVAAFIVIRVRQRGRAQWRDDPLAGAPRSMTRYLGRMLTGTAAGVWMLGPILFTLVVTPRRPAPAVARSRGRWARG